MIVKNPNGVLSTPVPVVKGSFMFFETLKIIMIPVLRS